MRNLPNCYRIKNVLAQREYLIWEPRKQQRIILRRKRADDSRRKLSILKDERAENPRKLT